MAKKKQKQRWIGKKLDIENKFKRVIFSTELFYSEKRRETCFQKKIIVV